MTSRAHTPSEDEAEVLTKCRRRCCICYGLNGDLSVKSGQIAHLDRDPSNTAPDNLAFLCLDHHDEFDGRTSQSKGITLAEVKHFRALLWQAIERNEHHPSASVSHPDTHDEFKTPYDEIIRRSPREAILTAWADVEKAALNLLDANVARSDRATPVPNGVLVAILCRFGVMNQGQVEKLMQLEHVKERVVNEPQMRCGAEEATNYCQLAVELIAALKSH